MSKKSRTSETCPYLEAIFYMIQILSMWGLALKPHLFISHLLTAKVGYCCCWLVSESSMLASYFTVLLYNEGWCIWLELGSQLQWGSYSSLGLFGGAQLSNFKCGTPRVSVPNTWKRLLCLLIYSLECERSCKDDILSARSTKPT